MTETLAYTYTTQAEIQRLAGRVGVNNIMQDLVGTDVADMWEEVIADATTTIDSYAAQVYNQSDLATSRWVRSRATWIAAYRLSMRKGNNDNFAERYSEIIEELEKVKSLILMIPNIPLSADMSPVMSNVNVNPHYNTKKIRVQPEISTGGSRERQDVDWQPWITDFL
jgi:phage gp36-like protein